MRRKQIKSFYFLKEKRKKNKKNNDISVVQHREIIFSFSYLNCKKNTEKNCRKKGKRFKIAHAKNEIRIRKKKKFKTTKNIQDT